MKQQIAVDIEQSTPEPRELEKAADKRPFEELGVTGLQHFSGLVTEEYERKLEGEKGRKVYHEMSLTDPTVGGVLYAIEMISRNVKWRVEGEDEDVVEFVDGCFHDMSTSWADTLAEILSKLVYGFSWHEVVYKKRDGPQPDNSSKPTSKFNDGKIGWRKLPIRAQDSLLRWEFDEEGAVSHFVQSAPPTYNEIPIPITRSLLFRTTQHKGNPEGLSILRRMYRPYYLKRHVENIEAIGVERDLAGLPVFWRSTDIGAKYDAVLKSFINNLRNDEQAGLLLPLVRDANGNKELEFELVSSSGGKQFDTTTVIRRLDHAIVTAGLADFLLLGQDKVGSFALASNKTELFAVALAAFLKSVASVFNSHGIPRLLQINAIQTETPPRLVPGDVETVDLRELGQYITSVGGAGLLMPDDDLENHLRQAANLPMKKEESF